MLCKLLDCSLLLQVLLGTPAGEFLKLASDQNLKPLQRLSGPAVAATLVDDTLGGQGMHAGSDSTTKEQELLKEVRDHMDKFVPGAVKEKYKTRAKCLSTLEIETFTGVHPDAVHVIEDYCLGSGGYGEVQL